MSTGNNNVTLSNGTSLLPVNIDSAFPSPSTLSSPPVTFFNLSRQTTIQNVLNWSSKPERHESSLGHTTSPANVSFHFDVSRASTINDSPVNMRMVGTTKVTSSPIQSTDEYTWDSSVIIAAALFILALSLVALALRILVPLYHHIMGHNESKEPLPKERHSPDQDLHRHSETHEIGEMAPSINSEEILLPFGAPATHMRPMMNYANLYPYQYPITYMPYQGPSMWSPQVCEQEYIIQQPIPHDHLNMGAIYRHNWDQLFEGVANETMLSYVGHPSEYRMVPASNNTKL